MCISGLHYIARAHPSRAMTFAFKISILSINWARRVFVLEIWKLCIFINNGERSSRFRWPFHCTCKKCVIEKLCRKWDNQLCFEYEVDSGILIKGQMFNSACFNAGVYGHSTWMIVPPLPPPIKLIGRCTTKLPSFVKQLKQFLLGILSILTVVHDGWSFTFKRSEQFAFRLSQHFCVCVSSHTTRQLSIESWNRYIRVNVSLVLSPEMTEKC